ncbi:unnamed protein product [Protopolystoma xenopodis]|uniref:Uncharacterized protein n=1 Tax=Protopolystoma xenopodis TaxID=117903 RepID=A0A3S5BFP9_9PLAT|nr:unnamed protein product [Protopolystoma xenopodis]
MVAELPSPPQPEPTQTQTETLLEVQEVAASDDTSSKPVPEANKRDKAESQTAFCDELHHELIICSEEQVKIFLLPSLRAKCKYKLISPSPTGWQRRHVTKDDKREPVDEKECVPEPVKESLSSETAMVDAAADAEENLTEKVEPTTTLIATVSARRDRRVSSFGLQSFLQHHVQGNADPSSVTAEWSIVLTLTDGHVIILSIPHLRRQLKGMT